MTISDLTERELIARIQQHLPPPPEWMVVAIGDDAAVVEPERNRLEVLSVDALVEGVHFDRRFTPASAIGHRALAVGLSDLAAMGAEPRLALLSLALPPALTCDEFDDLASGLAALATQYRLHVAGGNLTSSPGPIVVDVTVVGTVKRRQVLTRSGARPGDELYVSGTIGAAAAGLHQLKQGHVARTDGGSAASLPEGCIRRFLYPEPRVRLGLLLGRNRAASACVDLSDGLADGVRQIAHASGVGASINLAAIPIDPDTRATFDAADEAGSHGRRAAPDHPDAMERIIAAGDDYELLFAVRPRSAGRLRAARRHGGVPISRIGVCTANTDLVVQRPRPATSSGPAGMETRPLPMGYGHFR